MAIGLSLLSVAHQLAVYVQQLKALSAAHVEIASVVSVLSPDDN